METNYKLWGLSIHVDLLYLFIFTKLPLKMRKNPSEKCLHWEWISFSSPHVSSTCVVIDWSSIAASSRKRKWRLAIWRSVQTSGDWLFFLNPSGIYQYLLIHTGYSLDSKKTLQSTRRIHIKGRWVHWWKYCSCYFTAMALSAMEGEKKLHQFSQAVQ